MDKMNITSNKLIRKKEKQFILHISLDLLLECKKEFKIFNAEAVQIWDDCGLN